MDEVTGRLEDWRIQQVTKKECIVWGDCYDDIRDRFRDGELIHTSGVKNCKMKEGDIITTRNSTYLLGKKAEVQS